MARKNHETKKDWLVREVARAVNAGKAWDCQFGSVDGRKTSSAQKRYRADAAEA